MNARRSRFVSDCLEVREHAVSGLGMAEFLTIDSEI